MNLSNLFRTVNMRAMSVGLTLSLLVNSTPAASETVVGLGKESSRAFLFWFHNGGMSKLIQGRGAGNGRRQEKQRDRDAKIVRIKIFPEAATVDLGEHVRFSAVAYDQKEDAVGGIKVKWSGQESAAGRRAKVSQQGEFEALAPGSFTITAEANGQSAQATVVVRPGIRRDMNEVPLRTKSVSSRDEPTNTKKISSMGNPAIPGTGNRVATGRGRVAKRSHVKNVTGTPPTLMLPDIGWGDDNYGSADDPGNRIGNQPGTPLDDGAGSGNFQFLAPVLSLDGRGIDMRLALTYNSRLWNKSGTQINYDNDRGWPAPGFNLGFGKMLGMGVNGGGMLIDADGTRHAYSGSITFYNWGTSGVMHTADGSFIDYTYSTGTGGGLTYAFARLANGTTISFGAPGPGAIYPTSIEDANGNLITITYVNNSGPRIQTVTDTLNRTISFHYDTNNLLTAITAPGYISGTRTLARLHYHQLSLDTTNAFSGLTPSVREASPWVVDAIYYPGTSTGYWLNDSDSYSSYGMLAKVVEERGMGFSASGLTDMGSVSQGSVNRSETYNYPLTPNSSLTDAPTYTSMTNAWTRDGTNFDSATTGYEVHENSTPRTVTITLPNGTKSTQYSYNHSGNYDDGLVYYDETRDSNNNLLQSSSSNWAEGAYTSPRPTRVEKTDERGQVTAAEFSYGSVYNQVTEVRDYDYGGTTLLRSTRTEYQNNSNYTGSATSYGYVGRHIFNLPLNVEMYDSDGTTRLSRTEYQYDGQTLSATPNVVQHEQASNPYADAEGLCYTQPNWNDPDCTGNCNQTLPSSPDSPGCDGYCGEIYVCPYNSATDYRGNVTQITSYANATPTTPTEPITETRRYDVTGNLVTASTACCEQTSFNYTVDTQFAYPQSKTRGSASDLYAQVSTSATYDFNTGLGLSGTDANGRQSQTSYDSATLRPTTSSLPTGAHTDFAYDDAAMTVSSTTYLASGEGGGIADQSVKYLNGMGQVRQEKARGVNNTWDLVDTIYNNLGQVYQQSRPYRSGDTQQWTTATYDALGRTKTITAPDGSVTQTFYNETSRPDVASSTAGETTRVQDAWGRERWGRTDASGRLVEVVEPNPGGNGSVATSGLVTTYAYNTLGNLITVSQGAQTRSFAYDSLGRLTGQKLAEQSATLNDSGTYVGSGTWSDVFTYDSRSNLTSRTDARGVKTVYSYSSDPLNRLQSVSWDTSGFGDTDNPIVGAATVSYSYRTKSSSSELKDVTQLSGVTASGVSTESYGYDTEGRVSSQTVTLSSRSSYPFVTDYIYDSLDRATDVRYPAEYGNGSAPRKVVHYDYDIASRLTGLSYDGQSFASSIVYNAASQTTSLNVGSGANQIEERYNYDSQTGLLSGQTVAKSATPTTYLLNLEYQYTNSNGKRTGQLTKILNNLNHNRDRGYVYDALGRLVQATGGPSSSVLSTQTYTYDNYGNRLTVSASGNSAKLSDPKSAIGNPQLAMSKPSDPKVDLPTDLIARINRTERDNKSGAKDTAPLDDASRSLFKPSSKENAEAAPPSDPPTFTDPNLLAVGVAIRVIHITELRTAINNLRVRLGMSQFTWTKPTATYGVVATGGLITAEPIIEMRTALDQALGAPSPAYASGLAQGQPILAVHIQELRDRVVSGWNASSQMPRDGHASLSYDTATNRITTSGFDYDKAGNQVRAMIPGGTASQRYKYDAANRLVQVRTDDNNTVVGSYTYGDSNARLIAEENGVRTYYVGGGSSLAEYVETGSSTTPAWSKGYVYLGGRLLSSLTPNGSGGESVEFHHPDRLGTPLVTNPSTGTSFEQVSLPFGTALYAESTGATNRRFTTYDRSDTTKLDYAVNRHYDPQQGHFTQVDPIGMKAVSLENPQTLNLYSYCGNDPVNHTDPDGLFSWFKALLGFLALGPVGLLFGFQSVRRAVVRAIHVVAQVVGKILNNRWVRIGIFIASFLVPFLPALQTVLDIFNTISDIVQTMQLTDMLLQHKWKEFGLSIAIGLASAAISVVADHVIESVKAHLKGGFTFKGLFQGAWEGLRKGFADVFGRGWESLIPVYGKYCAPGASRGGGINKGPAIDGIDKLCRTHDEGYLSKANDKRLIADKDLFRGLFTARSVVQIGDIVFAGRPSGGNVYRFVAFPVFGSLIVYRSTRP
ncbi:MAG: RHS repeat-associated core domain-containing protein [Pyrinomonadaceae bacterium]